MEEKRTSVWENGLLWFGAAVSLAEILTGTYLAPLGFSKGLTAILFGHLIGCVLLFFAGLIGGKVRKSAMETVKMSFGQRGGMLFSVLNVIQLVGWTAIMIYDGAVAANGIFAWGEWIWALVIGMLIVVWLVIGIKSLGKLNFLAMTGLFLLTLVLSFVVFQNRSGGMFSAESISFGAAVELSVAMPLSWLPLISDYTKEAEKPVRATAFSCVVYGLVSSWMYLIGMGAAIFAGSSDIAQLLLHSGLGFAGLLIVVLSTVTTTFLDAYSAGISAESLCNQLKGKWIAVAVAVLGTVAAAVYPMTDITGFLYLIGSVFAPMIAVQIADFFLLRQNAEEKSCHWSNLGIWCIGFLIYRFFMKLDFVVGTTLPAMLITVILCVIFHWIAKQIKEK